MPMPLHEEAISFLRGQGLPITTETLGKTMNYLAKSPQMSPSMQNGGGDQARLLANMGGGAVPEAPMASHEASYLNSQMSMNDGLIDEAGIPDTVNNPPSGRALPPGTIERGGKFYNAQSIPQGKLSGIVYPDSYDRSAPKKRAAGGGNTTTTVKAPDGTTLTKKEPSASPASNSGRATSPDDFIAMVNGSTKTHDATQSSSPSAPPIATAANPNAMPTSAPGGPSIGGSPGSGAGNTALASEPGLGGEDPNGLKGEDRGSALSLLPGVAGVAGLAYLLARLFAGRKVSGGGAGGGGMPPINGLDGEVIPPANPMSPRGGGPGVGQTIERATGGDIVPRGAISTNELPPPTTQTAQAQAGNALAGKMMGLPAPEAPAPRRPINMRDETSHPGHLRMPDKSGKGGRPSPKDKPKNPDAGKGVKPKRRRKSTTRKDD